MFNSGASFGQNAGKTYRILKTCSNIDVKILKPGHTSLIAKQGDIIMSVDTLESPKETELIVSEVDSKRVHKLKFEGKETFSSILNKNEKGLLTIFAKLIISKYGGSEIGNKTKHSGNGWIDREDASAQTILDSIRFAIVYPHMHSNTINDVRVEIEEDDISRYFSITNDSEQLLYFTILEAIDNSYCVWADFPNEFMMVPPTSTIPVHLYRFGDEKSLKVIISTSPLDLAVLQEKLRESDFETQYSIERTNGFNIYTF